MVHPFLRFLCPGSLSSTVGCPATLRWNQGLPAVALMSCRALGVEPTNLGPRKAGPIPEYRVVAMLTLTDGSNCNSLADGIFRLSSGRSPAHPCHPSQNRFVCFLLRNPLVLSQVRRGPAAGLGRIVLTTVAPEPKAKAGAAWSGRPGPRRPRLPPISWLEDFGAGTLVEMLPACPAALNLHSSAKKAGFRCRLYVPIIRSHCSRGPPSCFLMI